MLANRTKYGERCFPALASSREPHWCLDKQGKALYTDLDISPVKSYLQWRTLIEILEEACWGKVGVDWKHSTGFENKKSSPRFTFSKHHWRMWKNTGDKFSFSAHISSHHFNYSYQSCCPLHSHFYLPQHMNDAFHVFSSFAKQHFLCTRSAGAAKTLTRGEPIITYENSYTLLFILLQGLEQGINSHENEVIALQASDS